MVAGKSVFCACPKITTSGVIIYLEMVFIPLMRFAKCFKITTYVKNVVIGLKQDLPARMLIVQTLQGNVFIAHQKNIIP